VTEKYGKDSAAIPVAPAPFRFSSWEEGQALILLRNENYFEKDSLGHRLPYLNAIKTTFFDNKATEFLLFRQGQLDSFNDIDPSFKDEILSKKGELKKAWQGKIMPPFILPGIEYLGILVDTANEVTKNSALAEESKAGH